MDVLWKVKSMMNVLMIYLLINQFKLYLYGNVEFFFYLDHILINNVVIAFKYYCNTR